MSIYEASITNPKKQLEFYKDLSEQLQRENEKLKQKENNWNELKDSLEKDIKEYEESEFHIKEPPLTIQTKIDLLLKMQEIESRK